jgi:hypothetical protein
MPTFVDSEGDKFTTTVINEGRAVKLDAVNNGDGIASYISICTDDIPELCRILLKTYSKAQRTKKEIANGTVR